MNDHPQSRVLYMEDDDAQGRLVQKCLQRAGYAVELAADGLEGLTKCSRESFDVLVVDQTMPGLNGLEVIRALVARGPLPPTIVVTGTGSERIAVEAMKLGASDYLVKDMEGGVLKMLPLVIRRALEQRELARAKQQAEEALNKRVKELNCLYGLLSRFEDRESPLAEIVRKALELIPPAWQYPEVTYARFVLEGQVFQTGNFVETAWRQSASVIVNGQWAGALEVGYLEERPAEDEGPFLREERALVDVIAERLGRFLERTRAEQKLRESEARFRTLVEHLPQRIFLKDANSVYVDCNNNYAEDLGIEPGTIAGKTDFMLHPQELAEKYRADDRRIITEGKKEVIEEPYLRGGHECWVRTIKVPFRDQAGNIVGVLGIFEDFTARKQAEEALRESEKKWRMLFDEARDGILLADMETTTFISGNKTICQMLGYSEEELRALGVADIHPTKDLPFVREQFQGQARREIGIARDIPVKRKDGSVFYADVNSTPLVLGGNSVLVGIFRDITERKRMEQELAQAQKLQAVGHLAAGIAHEINTPTQYIGDNTRFLQDAFGGFERLVGALERLLAAARSESVSDDLLAEVEATLRQADATYLCEQIPRAIEQSLEGVDRVAGIVRAMKEFSHPGSPGKQPIDLNRAIANTLTISRNEWKYVAEVATDFDPSLPPVYCLPSDFNQVILNLVVNAAQAIAPLVQGREDEKGTIAVRTRRDGDWAEIRVEDTGGGIPPEIRDKIFDPFFTTKEVGKGTGQGLTIAHAIIVEKHGGTIRFESEVGRGATFIIRLPLDGKPAPAETA